MEEKEVGKEVDQLQQHHRYISGHHAYDQSKPGNRQYAPCCGEVPEGVSWSCELLGSDVRCCLDGYAHGPAFLFPPVRGFSAAASFPDRFSPVRRRTLSTRDGPMSRSSCRAAAPSLRRRLSPSGVTERVTCRRSSPERLRRTRPFSSQRSTSSTMLLWLSCIRSASRLMVGLNSRGRPLTARTS